MAMAQGALDPRVSKLFLPYQQEWIKCAFFNPFVVGEKSRQIGVTWTTAYYAPIHAAQGAAAGGCNIWYIGYKASLGYEFIRDVGEATRHYQTVLNKARAVGHFATVAPESKGVAVPDEVGADGQVITLPQSAEPFKYHDDGRDDSGKLVGDERDILAFQIRYASGLRVGALTSAPRNIRGLRGMLVIDEAAYHQDLPGLLKAATAFQIWGGRVVVISTHDGVDNEFYKLCEAIKTGLKPGVAFWMDFKGAVADGLYARRCQKLGEEYSQAGEDRFVSNTYANYGQDAVEELDVVPKRAGGSYMGHALIESCMYPAPVLRLTFDDDFSLRAPEDRAEEIDEWIEAVLKPLLEQINVERHSTFGADFGRTSDLSVFAPLIIEQDLTRRIPFLIELRKVPHAQQWQVLQAMVDGLPHLSAGWMDAGGNGSWLAEQAVDQYGGGVVTAWQIHLKWYAVQLPILLNGMESGELKIPKDVDVRNDLAAFRVINGVPKLPDARGKDAENKPRHGDAGVAIAMAYGAAKAGDSLDYLRDGLGTDAAARAFGIGGGAGGGIWGG